MQQPNRSSPSPSKEAQRKASLAIFAEVFGLDVPTITAMAARPQLKEPKKLTAEERRRIARNNTRHAIKVIQSFGPSWKPSKTLSELENDV